VDAGQRFVSCRDEAGHKHAAATLFFFLEGADIAAADLEDRGFVEGDVAIADVGVTAGLLVIGDDGFDVSDDVDGLSRGLS
jgi:hypothetical protein